jgi:hypothetical protein
MSQTYRKIRLALLIFGFITLGYTLFELFVRPKAHHESLIVMIECLIGIALIFTPEFLTKVTKFRFPEPTIYFFWLFLVMAVFIGTCWHVISIVPFWDKILHLTSPMILTTVGYSLIVLLLKDAVIEETNYWLYLILGFAFAGLCGVFWEFWEFACDQFGMNLQRYATSGGIPLIGRAALMDTMGDLFTNTIGALIMMIYTYTQCKKDERYFERYRLHRVIAGKLD